MRRRALGAGPFVVAVLSLAAATLGLAGCGSGGDGVTVAVAASLAPVFADVEAIAGEAGIDVAVSAAGSPAVVEQVRRGAPIDVVAVADPALLERLRADGLLDGPSVRFAANTLVVVAGPGSPVEALDDLARPGVRVVLGLEAVPVGAHAREGLARAGLLDAVAANVVSEEPDVTRVAGRVSRGEADAGVVYATDARVDDRLVVVARLDAVAEYAAAVVTGADEGARRLVEMLASDGPVREALARRGFEPVQERVQERVQEKA